MLRLNPRGPRAAFQLKSCTQTMQALFGHIDPAMLKRYSHTRRRALGQAANALQPAFISQQQNAVQLVN
jgi:hypothetical protein